MTVSHNFVAADPLWKDTWYYFKLGNYIQDSVDSSEEAYSDVWVYSSGISHSETVEKTPVESIRIDSSEIQLQPGERTSLSVTVKPIKAYNKAVTWDVLEGADVVAVDAKGYVTALKEGTAVVRATSVDNSPSPLLPVMSRCSRGKPYRRKNCTAVISAAKAGWICIQPSTLSLCR